MKKLILIFALFAAVAVQAQEVTKETFLYSVKETDSLRVDRYRVQGETLEPSPCLIFVFGGGFAAGTRDAERYIPFFEYYAKRGFTVASIDYRLGLRDVAKAGKLDASSFGELFINALSMANEDLLDATAYILNNAQAWNIDPSKVVVSGSSAGAITVLMSEYYLCKGTMLARKVPAEFNYAGVISFAGAIFSIGEELDWGGARKPAPMLMFHGDADPNVPYGAIREMGAGFFGSEYISNQLTAMRLPHVFYSEANTGHILADSPMNDNRFEIDAFLEKLVFQHQPLIIRTNVTQLDKPVVNKKFSLTDYVKFNFR